MESHIRYTVGLESWDAKDATETILLTDLNGTTLGRIPFRFTQVVDSILCDIQYLFVVVECLLQKTPREPLEIHFQGRPVQANDRIRPGTYVVQLILGVDAEMASGPHSKTTTRKPFEQSDVESVSNSSRTSRYGQSKFREKIFHRDPGCLLTHTFYPDRLRACHIIPFSLGSEFVSQVSNGLCDLYSPANGLTLRSDYHSLFDNYNFGIYCINGTYQVHFFAGDTSLLQHHGQWLHFSDAVRQQAPGWLPNASCLAWHYKQCILAAFRGYYVQPTL